MVDTRFDSYPVDGRFSTPGVDGRFEVPGVDDRFPNPGDDTRFGIGVEPNLLEFEFLGESVVRAGEAQFRGDGGVPPYQFDPGDGTFPQEVPAPTIGNYRYQANGTYTATLTDSVGTVETAEAVVDWIAPELIFNALGNFENSAAFFGSGGVPPYTFDAGDGTPAVLIATPTVDTYYYAANGTYTATLTDADGTVKTAETVVDWVPDNPTFKFQYLGRGIINQENAVFRGEGGEPPYQFDPGDGAEPLPVLGPTVEGYRYAKSGLYLAKLTDSLGKIKRASVNVTWMPEVLSLTFAFLGRSPTRTNAAIFAGANGRPPYIFDPGDGSPTVELQNPTLDGYVYAANGTYTATLTDSEGTVRTDTVVVDWIATPLEVTTTKGPNPGEWYIDVVPLAAQGEVNWGDGTVSNFTRHVYAENGVYTVVVFSVDPNYADSSVQITVDDLGVVTGDPITISGGAIPGQASGPASFAMTWTANGIAEEVTQWIGEGELYTRSSVLASLKLSASGKASIAEASATTSSITLTPATGYTLANGVISQRAVREFGPFTDEGVTYFLRGTKDAPELGIDIDNDPDADIWVTATRQPRGVSSALWQAVLNRIDEVLPLA